MKEELRRKKSFLFRYSFVRSQGCGRTEIEMSDGVEIEKKFVIALPDIDKLRGLDGYSESEILQIYLNTQKGITHRIRKRTNGTNVSFTETKKRRIDKMSSFESEHDIDERQFSALSENLRAGSRPIIKKRITFLYAGRLFEVDIYPEWKRSCIMEVELPGREDEIKWPPFIELIADVTGKSAYSNSSMSSAFPNELV